MAAKKSKNYEDGRPFDYSKRNIDLTNAYVCAKHADGTILEPLSKFYHLLDREQLTEVTIKSGDHRPLYTLAIKDKQFAFRKRNYTKPFDPKGQWTFDQPKRCIVLATKGKVVFFWDSEEIKEFDAWQNDAIYNQRDMKEIEV